MEEYAREPCPWRILDDSGGAFAMGLIGGTIFNTYKGFRNAPSGIFWRVKGALENVQRRSPLMAGSFAVWGGVFSTCDCTLAQMRKKEDPYNAIISGAATGAILSARLGVAAMLWSAFLGGTILTAIEGVSVFLTWFSADQFKPVNPALEDPPQLGSPNFVQNNFQ